MTDTRTLPCIEFHTLNMIVQKLLYHLVCQYQLIKTFFNHIKVINETYCCSLSKLVKETGHFKVFFFDFHKSYGKTISPIDSFSQMRIL